MFQAVRDRGRRQAMAPTGAPVRFRIPGGRRRRPCRAGPPELGEPARSDRESGDDLVAGARSNVAWLGAQSASGRTMGQCLRDHVRSIATVAGSRRDARRRSKSAGRRLPAVRITTWTGGSDRHRVAGRVANDELHRPISCSMRSPQNVSDAEQEIAARMGVPAIDRSVDWAAACGGPLAGSPGGGGDRQPDRIPSLR